MTHQIVGRLNGAHDMVASTAPVPVASPGDIVIEVAACGICGTDLAFYRHGSPPSGAILGHEFSGRVTAIGAGVDDISIGDRVVVNPMDSGLGLGQVAGAFAQYVRLPGAARDRNLFVLPDQINDDMGAMIEPFAVALHAIHQAQVTADDRIVIFGAGTIGLCVLAGLRARGHSNILVVDLSVRRLALATQMGAHAVHNPVDGRSPAFVGQHFGSETVRYASEPLGLATLAFDCAGSVPALRDALHTLAPKGRLVLVADPHGADLPNLRLVMLRELTLVGALAYETEFLEAIDLLSRNAVDLMPMVTHRFAMDRINDAFRVQMDPDAAVKVLVYANGPEQHPG